MDYSFISFIPSIFLGAILIFIYILSFCNNTYWKKKGIPFVESNILQELFPSIKEKTIEQIQIERREKYGRIYGYYEKNTPILSISDPELLKYILVKDFKQLPLRRNFDKNLDEFMARMLMNLGYEDWKKTRSLISPTFSTGKLKKVLPMIEEHCKTLVKCFETNSLKNNNHIEVKRIFRSFNVDTLASFVFSVKPDSMNNSEEHFTKNIEKFFKPISWMKLVLCNVVNFMFGPKSIKLFFDLKELKYIENDIFQIVQERMNSKRKGHDILQALLSTPTDLKEGIKSNDDDDVLNDVTDTCNNELKENSCITKSLTQTDIVSQCGNLFLAGHTTSLTLTFACYFLALHQDVQEKVHKEITTSLKENKGIIDLEVLKKMLYLDNIISETLRIYPPTTRLERVADTDYKLGSTGLIIPKGMKITVPVLALQRDPKFFSKPEEFDPDRFNRNEMSEITPYSYIPFGAGPKFCVAERFALIELKVCLIYLISSFHIQKCSHTKIPLEFNSDRFLLPLSMVFPKEVYLKMIPRRENPAKD